MNLVDPHPVHVGQGFNILVGGQRSSVSKRPIWLVEAACLSMALPPAIPAHGGIIDAQTISASFTSPVSAKTPKDGLAKLSPSCRAILLLAGTAIVENTLGHLSQAEGIVKLPVGEQPGIRGDLGTVEFKLQGDGQNRPEGTPVSIHPSGVPYPPLHVCYNFMILIAESPSRRTEYRRYLGNAGLRW